MKKLNYVLLCCLLGISLQAQTYQDIFEAEKTWRYAFTACDAGGGVAVFTEGDTIIEGQSYRIIQVSNCGVVSTGGFVRTDADNARLWLRRPGGEDERLLMDLNLQEGETFTIYNEDQPEAVIADSVRTLDGRRYVFLSKERSDCLVGGNSGIYLRFIEGVGPTTGFFSHEGSENLFAYFLACVESGTEAVYQEPALSSLGCDFDCITTGTHSKGARPMAVSAGPNPVNDQLFLSLSEFPESALRLQLCTAGGRLIVEQPIHSKDTEVDMSALPAGIFFLILRDNRGRVIWSRTSVKN